MNFADLTGFPCFLGGSRRRAELTNALDSPFKIQLKQDTDWDLYSDWSEKKEKILIKKGFVLNLEAAKCQDSEALLIYQKSNIDFIFRKNAQFYRTVFENITDEFYYKYIWKSSPWKPEVTNIAFYMEQFFSIGRAFYKK